MSTSVGEIAGAVTTARRASEDDARRLLRGYAGAPTLQWREGSIALAGAGQAELSVHDDLVVLAEGRLDNRREFAHATGQEAGRSLAELIVAGWRTSGPAITDLITGDVAALVVDRRERRLHGLRDLCAGRPLHVSQAADGTLMIASDWQPLVEMGGHRRTPNREWFASMFTGSMLSGQLTPYSGVDIVAAGHVASSVGGTWSQTSHATLHVERLTDRHPEAYRERFRAVFDTAVRDRVADQPGIGVTLSGGLDSTSIMVTAAVAAPEVPRTALCMPMTHPAGDERAFQTAVATRAGADLRWVNVDHVAPLGGEDGPAAVLERFGAPPLVINWGLSETLANTAGQLGLGTVLDGEDGDSLLSGNSGFFPDLLVRGRWRTWIDEWRLRRDADVTGGRALAAHSLYLLAPPRLRAARDRMRGGDDLPPLVATRLASEIGLAERLSAVRLNDRWRPGRTFSLLSTSAGQPEYTSPLYTYVAEAWRRRGIAISHPFADRRLMSFCMGLPFEHVCKGGSTKIVLRQAMRGRLPHELVTRRTKSDISEVAWRAAYGVDRAALLDGLALAQAQGDWFDARAVNELRDDFLAEGQTLALSLRVAMLAHWLRWCEAA